MKKIKRKIKIAFEILYEIVKYLLLYPIAFFYYRKGVIYLFSERGVDARDNAYHLYKYFKENYPHLKTYFVIDKNSPDYSKITKLGNQVNRNSFMHYILFVSAKYKISTHSNGCAPKSSVYSYISKIIKTKGKIVFLAHGVIKDDLPQLYHEKTNANLFICGAKLEYEYVRDNFHYFDGQVKYTGLARYDNLHNNKLKRQILVMPTWRSYLKNSSEHELVDSLYFNSWSELLNDDNLIDLLNENNIDLMFYPHYEMQNNIHLFTTKSNRVIIADFKHYDVQELLKNSLLLITDYSSVYFDFAYMRKPLIYFQFDYEEFTKKHYNKGYFDYDKMGFGDLLYDEKSVVKKIADYINNNYQLEDKYMKRDIDFFPLYDKNNCKRIANEIMKL